MRNPALTESDAHVWGQEACERCGVAVDVGERGPAWCVPLPAWLAAHPADSGAWRRDGIRGLGEPLPGRPQPMTFGQLRRPT